MNLILAAAFTSLVGGSEAYALSCVINANFTHMQQVTAPFRVNAHVACSGKQDINNPLTYNWAPPMPQNAQFGSFILNYAGSNVGPVTVLEFGGCVRELPEEICEPWVDPNCGKRGNAVPVYNQKKFRNVDFYRQFKRLVVEGVEGLGAGRKLCSVVAVAQVDSLIVQVRQTCAPNCFEPPIQGPGDDPINTPCPPPPPPPELPIETPPISTPVPSPPGNGRISCTGQPVNIVTGSMWHQNTDFLISGRTKGTGLGIVRTYAAAPSKRHTLFGNRWHFNYETSISQVPGGDLDWIDETGGPWRYRRQSDGTFTAPLGQNAILAEFLDHYELRKSDRLTYFFHKTTGPLGKLYRITDTYGESVVLEYDDDDRLASVSAPFVGSISFEHNEFGYISKVTRNRDNLSYTYQYDSKFRLASVTDFKNRTFNYTYIDDKASLATQDLLEAITDPIGRRLWFTYDEQGRANNQYEPGGGVWSFDYGDSQTTVTAPNGGVTKYYFDNMLRETKRATPDGGRYYKTWENGRLTALRSEFGGTPKWTYDLNGNPTSIIRPEDKAPRQTTYDLQFNRPVLVQSASGAATHYTLDPQTGDVLGMSRGGLSLTFTYDQFGNLLSTSNGKTSYSNQRNADGQITRIFDLHNPQTLTYDLRGRVSSRSYLSGRIITYSYNDDDQVLTATDSHGPDTINTYDLVGRLIKTAVGAGSSIQETLTEYDEKDRIVSTVDPLGRVTRFEYDKVQVREKPIAVVDSAGRKTWFEYDALDRMIKRVDSLGGATKYSYDMRGNLTSVTDANGNQTRYRYDLNNRKIRETRASVSGTSASERIQLFFYDSDDRLVKELTKSSSGGQDRAQIYGYDDFDRLAQKIVQREGQSIVVEDISQFTYEDQLDSVLLKTAVNGVVSLGFSNESAPPFQLSAFSVSATQAGNPLGLIQGQFEISRAVTGDIGSVSSSGEVILSKAYDPAGRLMHASAGAFTSLLNYDAFGRKSNVSHSSGEIGIFQYDLLNRISSINWSGGSLGRSPIVEALTYDPSTGNVTSIQRENGALTIAYDAIDQITASTTTGGLNYNRSWTYDLLGNRLADSVNGSGSFTNNFLVANGISSFLADSNGFGETVRETTGATVKNYGYRADGLLSSVQNGATSAAYYFDALGRRVAKAIVAESGSFNQTFLHLGREDRVLLAKSGTGVVTTFVDGKGGDEHLGESKSGNVKGYVTDHIGSVLNSEPAGHGNRYGLFGESDAVPVVSPSSNPIQYGFTGREFDAESELGYHRLRMLHFKTGRWLSQDPIGPMGGPNFYAYALGNPLKHIDPLGLAVLFSSPEAQDLYYEARKHANGESLTIMQILEGAGNFRVTVTVGSTWEAQRRWGIENPVSTDAITLGNKKLADVTMGYSVSKPKDKYSQALLVHELVHAVQLKNGSTGNLDENYPEGVQRRFESDWREICEIPLFR